MATKQSKTYVGEPEVTPSGVVKRGTKRPPQGGTVRVTHKRESRAMPWLHTYTGAVIFVDTVAGLTMIYNLGLAPELAAHAMWAFGISHAVAMVAVLIPKRE